MSKSKDGVWTISCKCGPEKTLVITGDMPEERAIIQYNVIMCPDKKDIVITITIPADESVPVSLSCNAPDDDWLKKIENMKDPIRDLLKTYKIVEDRDTPLTIKLIK